MTNGSSYPEGAMTETAFVRIYGDQKVKLGEQEVELNTALAMEAAFCPADEIKRQDNSKRLAFLAGLVGRETLLPEHHYLLPDPEIKS